MKRPERPPRDRQLRLTRLAAHHLNFAINPARRRLIFTWRRLLIALGI